MSGVKAKYLLDTNYILGLLKSSPEVVDDAALRGILAAECAYSPITRMELLGYPDITAAEEALIRARLNEFRLMPISLSIENQAIALRQSERIKLPDAIIAATALCEGVELLTLDNQLKALVSQGRKA